MSAVLQGEGITVRFGGLRAVDDLSLELLAGEVHALLGPNGAGKTTCFNALSGVVRPDAGEVRVAGRAVTGASPARAAAAGLARTFQNVELFPGMSVLETVMVGYHRHMRAGALSAMLRLPRHHADERRARAAAQAALARVGIAREAAREAVQLPYGAQRLVELARALVAEPCVVLLDEPVAGLTPAESDEVAQLIASLARDGIGVLLVEHDMRMVMSIADRVTVMDAGRRIALGRPQEVGRDPAVRAAYLGTAPAPGDADAQELGKVGS